MRHLLLLRGLVREQRHWGPVRELLENRKPEIQTHFLDLPGVGTEVRRKSPRQISQIMNDIRGRWLTLKAGHPGDWHLACMSLGGMIGMQWAHEHPEDFKKLIVINSSAGNLVPITWRFRPKSLPGVVRALVALSDEARERNILKMTTVQLKEINQTAKDWAGFSRTSKTSRMTFFNQIYAASRFKAPKKLLTPTTFMVGEGDPLVDPRCTHTLAKFYHAPMVQHPTAGHDLSQDCPEWLVDQLVQIIRKGN